MNAKSMTTKLLHTGAFALVVAMSGNVQAAALNIADTPLFLSGTVPPLNLLVMGRDHKLYYEAYNDASDLNNDGELDVGYKGHVLKTPAPAADSSESRYKIDYFGYFDSYKCYNYDGSGFFDPVSETTTKTCSGNWSGDFLNYLTTSRIDALRKVLYGGDRRVDTETETILERSYIPQDAHSWGKQYESVAVNGYDIALYTPYSAPSDGNRYLFANTTPRGAVANGSGVYDLLPLLRVTAVTPAVYIWNWVSKEVPVAHSGAGSIDGIAGAPVIIDFVVKVKVCKSGLEETNCVRYPGRPGPSPAATAAVFKPTGLLQSYGEGASPRMFFGLMSGSYAKNTSGGVLRVPMGTNASNLTREIDQETGQYKDVAGIIRMFNRMHTTGFGTGYSYACGWASANSVITEGQCQMWGNPIAEIMYEGMRYLAGKEKSPAFDINGALGEETQLPGHTAATPALGLVTDWDDPYAVQPSCAKPFQTVISDINPSYDTDQLPGARAGWIAGAQPLDDLPTALNVTTHANTIWTNEFGGDREVFIGEVGNTVDGAPTPKTVTSFRNIRGLAPEEPTKRGGYYSASVAYHGHIYDMGSDTGAQKVTTFAIALASPLPKIVIPTSNGTVTLVPFAKSVRGSGINAAAGQFQPTNQIVDFYVDSLTATSGTFRVNFEDVEQGADHDMDAIAVYNYTVSGNTVTINMHSPYSRGGITQHMGYVISGTEHDGIYLEIRDVPDPGTPPEDPNLDPDYFLDTPPTYEPSVSAGPPAPATVLGWDNNLPQPWTLLDDVSRTFTATATPGAILLKDPLWYAAKWGGFKDANGDNMPQPLEWDKDSNGTPDNYFLVTNALNLGAQLDEAFRTILSDVGSASSASVNTGTISSETRVYQAKFNSADWTGQLLSFPVMLDNPATPVNEGGTLLPSEWDAALVMPAHGSRAIITTNIDNADATTQPVAVPFQWDDIGDDHQALLKLTATDDVRGEQRLEYLRGDDSHEQRKSGLFRNRTVIPAAGATPAKTLILGDIVSSSPIYVGKPEFGYPDTFETAPYSAFVTAQADRTKMVYVGANDGMLHAFTAADGIETLAFVPGGVFQNLIQLTRPNYSHKFFVDGTPTIGDVFYGGAWHTVLVGSLNKGGKSVFALDITNPGDFSEDNAGDIFRWEFSDADLGYTYSRPAVVRMHNGRWAAVFGNGYNNSGALGRAYLYVVDIETGTQIAKIDTGAGAAGTPNGLATPAAVDLDGDNVTDYVFAGDLLGNLWKFDVKSTDPALWRVAFDNAGTPTPLFVAMRGTTRQPITSRPEVGRGPKGVGMVVLFGTGKFMEPSDKSPTETQSFYGIFDANTGLPADIVAGRANLTQQSILVEQNFTFAGGGTFPLRVTSANPVDSTKRGWYMDLLSPGTPSPVFNGEMQVSNSVLRNGRIIFTTLIPNADPCSSGGTSWLMEMDSVSGARLTESPLDNNRDGVFNNSDFVTITVGPDTLVVPVSGIQSEVGIAQTPGILFDPGNGLGRGASEFKYMSGSNANAAGSNLQRVIENAGSAEGRQSWRQIK